MSRQNPKYFKKTLGTLGLSFEPGELMRSKLDLHDVQCALTGTTSATFSRALLTRKLVHDRLLELLVACHAHRDGLYQIHRMYNRWWAGVRSAVPWAAPLNANVIRELVLVIMQGAKFHWLRPISDHRYVRDIRPTPMSLAASHFIHDMMEYEKHLEHRMYEKQLRNFFVWEQISPDANGKPIRGSNGVLATIMVEPWPTFAPVKRKEYTYPARDALFEQTSKTSKIDREVVAKLGAVRLV